MERQGLNRDWLYPNRVPLSLLPPQLLAKFPLRGLNRVRIPGIMSTSTPLSGQHIQLDHLLLRVVALLLLLLLMLFRVQEDISLCLTGEPLHLLWVDFRMVPNPLQGRGSTQTLQRPTALHSGSRPRTKVVL